MHEHLIKMHRIIIIHSWCVSLFLNINFFSLNSLLLQKLFLRHYFLLTHCFDSKMQLQQRLEKT